MSIFTRTDQSFLGRWWWTVDRVILAMLLVISVMGVILVAAASPSVAERIQVSPNHFIIRHMIFLIPSLVLMIGLSMADLKQIWRAAVIVLAFSAVSMVLVLLFGAEVNDTQRWLQLGPLSIQPSELAKPASIVVAKWLIARQKEHPNFKGFFFASVVYAMVVGLLILQPDMGMTFVVTASFFTIIFLAGLPFRWIILLLVLAVGASFAAYYGFDHVQSRVDITGVSKWRPVWNGCRAGDGKDDHS
jgi:cell division protein FtsW